MVIGATSARSAPEPDSKVSVEEIRQLIFDGWYRQAEEAARQLLPEVEAETGSASLETAEVLDALAEALWRGGQCVISHECADVAERALILRENRLGDQPLVADSLVRKAEVLIYRDDLENARSTLLRALRIYESTTPTDPMRLARAHSRLADLSEALGEVEAWDEQSRLAVEIVEREEGVDPLVAAEAYTSRGNYIFGLGRSKTYPTDTEPFVRRALELRRGVLGEKHPLVQESRFFLGDVFFDLYRFEEALALQSDATETLARVLGPDNPLVADRLASLAYFQRLAGFPMRAEEYLQRALGILEPYPDSGLKANVYNLLGLQRHRQGELIEARRYYEAALKINNRLFGPGSDPVAGVLTNLGWLEKDLGELEDARRHLELGLEIASETWGAEAVQTVVFRIHLAEVEQAAGNLEAAEEIARQAWAIEESFLDPSRFALEVAALKYGVILHERGKLSEAEAILSRVLDVRAAGYRLRDRDLAANLIALADLRVDQGRVPEAVVMYEEALSITEEIFGPGHPMASETRLKLSRCASLRGEWPSAFDYSLQAELDAQDHTRTLLTGFSERVGLRYASTRPSGLDRTLSLLAERQDADLIRRAFDVVIRGRALLLDEMADRRRTLSLGRGSIDESLVEELIQSRKRLARLIVQGPGGGEPEVVERFMQAVAETTRERDRAERALVAANRAFRLSERQRSVGVDQIEAALPAGSGLLAFVRYERAVADGARGAYLAFLLRPDRQIIELADLGDAGEIDALVEQVREQVVSEAEVTLSSSGSRERAYRRAAERLRQRVWDPISLGLEGLDRVFVVPDGSLHLVSLAALPNGDAAYLLESGPRLHYLSAERDLLREPFEGHQGGLLAIGNPDFDEETLFADLSPQGTDSLAARSAGDTASPGVYRGPRSACESFETMRFEPLPASELEVQEVVGVWSEGSSDSGAVELLRGEAAESRVKRLASGRRVLHLATHGFYLGGDCPAYEWRDSSGERSVRFADLENPLLGSGLAFAGANHRRSARPDEDDGILTAEEVAAIDLFGLEWAVLSACESGVGDVRAGEGVFGLRRAFTSAGARTLIMSLWPVDDDATREWMRALYHHRFAADATTLDAVHQATLDLLNARRAAGLSTHPFYWAGFVAAGDWR